MRYVILTVFTSLFVAATALGDEATHSRYPLLHASVKKFGREDVNHYRHLHGWARSSLGKDTPGRNIVFYGMPAKDWPDRLATKKELDTTIDVLERWWETAHAPPVTSYQPQASASSYGGGGCTGMSAESGSAGYGAYNPAGPGYIGCYQIASGHYAAGGSCAGLGTDPAGQDACAQRICATEGPGAWTNSAGQNPCGRP